MVNASKYNLQELVSHDKFFRRKFLENEHMKNHVAFMQEVVNKRPHTLVDAYVYVLIEGRPTWERAIISDQTTKKGILELTF